MIFVSAITPIGGSAFKETVPASFFILALGDAIPSCDAAVGTLMKLTADRVDASLATSITFPPPTPSTRQQFFIKSCTSHTEFLEA